jgi:putative photosynthetic complex assembly protein 2
VAWLAALYALFAWWFSTGAILIVVRRADRAGGAAHGRALLYATPVLALGLAGLTMSAHASGTHVVWGGFASALAIWGWIELAFLSGVVTGPERRPCPPGLGGVARFVRAWRTVSHHELALLTGLLVVTIATTGAANDVAFWTYLILFVARISAKLNLFFGVPRINTEFVPRPLVHLKTYFRRGPVTPAFPISITVLTCGAAVFAQRLWVAETPDAVAAAALLTTLAVMAIVEHWLMVVPLPDAKLWRWMMPAPTPRTADVSAKER